MLDSVCDVNSREVYFLGDLNIDWFSSSCPLNRKFITVTSACNLVQVIHQPTSVFTNITETRSSTCIDHICTYTVELWSKAVSIPVGCSHHNVVAVSRKAKVPKVGPKIVYTRSYKMFCNDSYIEEETRTMLFILHASASSELLWVGEKQIGDTKYKNVYFIQIGQVNKWTWVSVDYHNQPPWDDK